jgi:hypothetical protein
MYQYLLSLQKDLEEEIDEKELADISFALRECENLLQDVRKEVSKTLARAKHSTCYVWTAKQMSNPNGEPIRTPYVTATPEIKMYVPFPSKKDKEGWSELMEYLGVSKETADNELVRPHYNSMLELCTRLSKEGKPLPPGLDPSKQKPIHDLRFRKTQTPIA